MCGICGFVGTGDRADLAAMTRALRHRGPDGEGTYMDPGPDPVHLGHRRLAIIDVAGGIQPMWEPTGTIGVVYNGEIYNHVELRKELLAANHEFKTDHSDTEVLIHGWRQWGSALVERLNGMFAFAIYDRQQRILFLARDRFGEKPLYYYHSPNLFGFASELRSLTLHSHIPTDLDMRSLQKYLAYGYVPAPNALYRGCKKLPAGAYLSIRLPDLTLKQKSYWRFELRPDQSLSERDEPALMEELRHLLRQAVKRRLISDVPIGFFLSGGIDSSAVVRLAADTQPCDSIKTFNIGFQEKSFDESTYARQVAEAIGVRHHVEILDLDAARKFVPTVLGHLDEPLGDASILPTSLLSRFTRNHVTVALSGDGGDELFAGYDPFKALRPADIYNCLVPHSLHKMARHLADRLPGSSRNMSMEFKIKRLLMGLSYRRALWNPVWMSMVEPAQMQQLFDNPLAPEELYSEALDAWENSRCDNLVDRTLEFYTRFYLTEDILMKVDRATMQWSLESRAVFLDNDLVAFCQRLPHHFKYRKGETKYLLKKALRDLLPKEILYRRKKGFGIPADSWLRQDIGWLGPRVRVPGMDFSWLTRCWEAHGLGRKNNRLPLWAWMTFEFAHQHREVMSERDVEMQYIQDEGGA